MSDCALKVFENHELVPAAWRQLNGNQPASFRVFNPTIAQVEHGYAMVYRVVDEERNLRRLASCQLTRDFEVVPSSVTALSDQIQFAAADALDERAMQWHADPRLAVLAGRIHLTWNDGGNKPINHQFIMPLDAAGLRPAAPARELTRDFSRVGTEKNWMLFEHQGKCYATYAICPHEVLEVDFSDARRVVCRELACTHWESNYGQIYGVLRGSAAPVWDGDGFLVIAHSSYKSVGGRRYTACCYRFGADVPFSMTHVPAVPLELPNPKGTEFQMPKLNPEVCEVIYPCGFVLQGQAAIISYGINDEACAIARIPLESLRTSMEAAANQATRTMVAVDASRDEGQQLPQRRAKPAAVPLFWWDALGKRLDGKSSKRVFATGNFGDIASADIVARITGRRVRQPRANERKLLSIGSVLHTARNGDVVWGTGAKGGKTELDPSVRSLSVHAVRGPLTLDVLRLHRIDVSKVKELFDPGCLLPLLYKDEIQQLTTSIPQASRGYRIVPHYRDDVLMRRRDWKHLNNFVSADTSPAAFIASIYGAERVISSSLHGIIFAEALGIPACWLAPLAGEDERKYYDYYYGTGRWAVKRFETVEDALRAEPMPLPKFRFDDYVATFPHEEIEQLAPSGIVLGERIQFAKLPPTDLDDCLTSWNLDHLGRSGLWATANRSRIQTHVSGCSGVATLELELLLHPFNPPQFKEPQRAEVTLNGRASTCVEWPAGSDEAVRLNLRVPHDGSERCFVDLTCVARNARSPRSLGLADVEDRLAVCLRSMVAREATHVIGKISALGGDE